MKKIILVCLIVLSTGFLRAQDSAKIQQFVHEWLGRTYRFGGTSKKGIDCSGFTQRFYKDVLGLEIPRTCYYQQLDAIQVDSSSLQPGDIIFFNSKVSPSGRHCGIYIGNEQFIHAANTRDGVKISCLDEPMYRRLYRGAGRYK